MRELAQWDSFYVIIGSAAGALIGLQFVVMTLVANRPRPRTPHVGAAFATPTIVHFSAVLLLAALLRAPWPTVNAAATAWGLLGLGGALYAVIVAHHMYRQDIYAPVFEDWLCHAVLPLIAYAILASSSFFAARHLGAALFAVGTSALLLLFSAVHNAWDAVAYHVFSGEPSKPREGAPNSGA